MSKSTIHSFSVGGIVGFSYAIGTHHSWWAWVGMVVCCGVCGAVYGLAEHR
jgi:hypothetical protein